MNKVTLLVGLLVFGGAAFAAGYAISNRSTPSTGPKPEDAARELAELVRKYKGPFKQPLDAIRVETKLGEARAALVKLGPGQFDRVIALLGTASDPYEVRNTKEPDADVRVALITVLPELDPARAAADLAARVNDTNEQGRVRAAAAGLLAHLDRGVAMPALARALDDASQHPWAGSSDVAVAVTFLGGDDAGEALLKSLLRPSTEPQLRIAVAEGLGRVHYAKAWDALENVVLHEESDHNIRRAAMRALIPLDAKRARQIAEEQIPIERDPGFQVYLQEVAKTLQ